MDSLDKTVNDAIWAERSRAIEIFDACEFAGRLSLASGMVADGRSVADCKATLIRLGVDMQSWLANDLPADDEPPANDDLDLPPLARGGNVGTDTF
jgi:hypothetical protein